MAAGISVAGNLSIAPTGTATASIGTGLNLTINTLTLGGVNQVSGTWGSTTSTATHTNDTYFAATTGILTVTTIPGAPNSTTNAAGNISGAGATLNGTVNANGTSTTVTFKYGTASDLTGGTTVAAAESPVTGSSDTPVSLGLTGLTTGITYYFQVIAVNTFDTTNGSILSFTIPADFQTHQTGNWNDVNTWERWNGTAWVNPAPSTPTFADGVITILNGHTVTIPTGMATFSVDQLVVASGGTLIQNTANNITVADGTGTDLDVFGTVRVNQGCLIKLSGTGSPTIKFDANSVFELNWSTSTGAGAIPTATWDVTSTMKVIGITSASGGTDFGQFQSFGNLIWNCPSQTITFNLLNNFMQTTANPLMGDLTIISTGSGALQTGTTTSNTQLINGNFNLQGGTLQTTTSATKSLEVKGNVSLTGGTFTLSTSTGHYTLKVDGNFSHTGGAITDGSTSSGFSLITFQKAGTQTYTFGGTGSYSGVVNFSVVSGSDLELGTNLLGSASTGAFTLSSGATLGIGDTSGITSSGASGNIRVSGARTYDTGANYTYNGTAAQNTGSGLPATVNNLTISNTAGDVTLDASVAISATLQIDASAVLAPIAAGIISGAGGTLTGSGTAKVTRTAATADFSSQYTINTKILANLTVEYAGSAAQVISTLTYGHLKMNNSNGVTMGGNATVNGTLTLTSGNITTGASSVIISSSGSVSRTSGHIVGNFKKNIATGATSKTFEIGDASNYTPVTVAFGNVTVAGDLTTSTTSGDHSDISNSAVDGSKSVNRFWTLTNSGIIFNNYSATFNFVSGDKDALANTATFIVANKNGGTWTTQTVGTKTSTSTQATGVTVFGDFVVGNAKAPDLVILKSVQTFSDPMNNTTNPKSIPGAVMLYTIQISNQGVGTVDNNSTVITDPISSDTKLFVNDFGGAGSGPVSFTDGTPVSGLTYTFTSLSNTSDDLDFSNNSGSTWTYVPSPDGDGCDSNVTNIRVNPKGILAGTGGGNPSLEIRFKVIIK